MATSIPYPKLIEICERAVRYHRKRVTYPEHPLVIDQSIMATPRRSPIMVGKDGWAEVGTVDDLIGGHHLRVLWNVETGKVQLERPVEQPLPPPPRILGDPLYRTVQPSTKGDEWPFTATPGYIYTYAGVEYDWQANRAAHPRTTVAGGVDLAQALINRVTTDALPLPEFSRRMILTN